MLHLVFNIFIKRYYLGSGATQVEVDQFEISSFIHGLGSNMAM